MKQIHVQNVWMDIIQKVEQHLVRNVPMVVIVAVNNMDFVILVNQVMVLIKSMKIIGTVLVIVINVQQVTIQQVGKTNVGIVELEHILKLELEIAQNVL